METERTKRITLEYPDNFDRWQVAEGVLFGPCGCTLDSEGEPRLIAEWQNEVDKHNQTNHAKDVTTTHRVTNF